VRGGGRRRLLPICVTALLVGAVAVIGDPVSVSHEGAYAGNDAAESRFLLPPVPLENPFAPAAGTCAPAQRQKFLRTGTPVSRRPAIAGSRGEDLQPAVRARVEKTQTVRSGDTFTGLMRRMGVRSAESLRWYRAAKPVFDLSRLRPGRDMTLFFDADGQSLEEIHYELDQFELVVVERAPDGSLEPRRSEAPALVEIRGAGGSIGSSITADCMAADVPQPVVQKLSDIFAWEIDFRRLQRGDQFRVLYEMKRSLDGKITRTGNVIAAEVVTGGKTHTAIRYADGRGRVGYFDLEGRPVAMSAVRYPVEFTRISSKFSRSRKHPVFGRRRPHLGVDFAAPRGTPVRAIAGGRIVYAGRKGQLGRAVRIDHETPSRYDSVYGHMHRIAKGIKRGGWVQKGQVIGTVGSTGAATGPHLHFSLVDGKRYVDPLKALPTAAASTLKRPGPDFHERKGEIVQAMAGLAAKGPVRLTRIDDI
jgi:murein DD-endopeptidase MepM/ murein hydrolase activator NlpD